MNDRRMAIMTLCSTDESVLFRPHATAISSQPPTTSICDTGPNMMQISTVVAKLSTLTKCSRRLSNSERGKLYRSRRKNYVETLEEQVKQVKKEISQLDLCIHSRQQRMMTCPLMRQPMGSSFASIVNEYFSLFKYGVAVAEHDSIIKVVPQDQQFFSSRQMGFLTGLMHPNVVFMDDSYGIHELLNQWTKYSLYHAGLKFEIKSLQIMAADPDYVVFALATLYVRFTRRTIEKIFPHVLGNEALVQRLIGKEFAYSVGNTFYFGDDNKIHRYETCVDFVTAFVNVLGSVKDSMLILDRALIQQESMIGDMLEEPHSIKVEETQGAELAPSVRMVDSDRQPKQQL